MPGHDSASLLDGECGVGILTMEDRNLWAHHREALKAQSVHNRFVLQTINSALLVVCFDKSSPNNMTERSQALLHGTLSSICNRWFDKFQVIADDDGNVGINFEHSHADGVSWNRWLTEVSLAPSHCRLHIPHFWPMIPATLNLGSTNELNSPPTSSGGELWS